MDTFIIIVLVVVAVILLRSIRQVDEYERGVGLNLALQMLKRCKEIWVFGDVISAGMRGEIEFAKKHNIPIRYFSEQCVETYHDKSEEIKNA